MLPSRRFPGSSTLSDIAAAATVDVASEGIEIRVFAGRVDLWDSNSIPKWIMLADFDNTLTELWASYPGFNTVKFLEIHETAAPITTTPAIDPLLVDAHSTLCTSAVQARTHLPPEYSLSGGNLSQDKALYNDLIRLCRQHQACFSQGAAPTKGKQFLTELRDVLWAIDTHLDNMNNRGKFDKDGEIKFAFPELFKQLPGYHDFDARVRSKSKKPADYYGYNNWREKGIAKPKLDQEKVASLAASVATILERPHISQDIPGWKLFQEACSQLLIVLTNWKEHLIQELESQQSAHHMTQELGAVATEDDESRVIESSLCKISNWARPLHTRLRDMEHYKPILINEYLGGISPQLRNKRMKNFKLPYAVKVYKHCSPKQNLYFVWKLPGRSKRSDTQNDAVIMAIRNQLPFYSSRASRMHFSSLLMKMGSSGPLGGTAARKLLQECFSDVSLDHLSDPAKRARLDRLTKAIEDGGEEIILDLRQLNFRVDDPIFDTFWDWCAAQFENSNNTAVDSRRADRIRLCPMAKFSSAPDMMREARKQLGDDVAIPGLR